MINQTLDPAGIEASEAERQESSTDDERIDR
jgi:hypothetical protein